MVAYYYYILWQRKWFTYMRTEFYVWELDDNMSEVSPVDVWQSNGIHLSLIFRPSFFDFFQMCYFPLSPRMNV